MDEMTLEQAIEHVESLGFVLDEFMGKYAVKYKDGKYFLPYQSAQSLVNFATINKASENWN